MAKTNAATATITAPTATVILWGALEVAPIVVTCGLRAPPVVTEREVTAPVTAAAFGTPLGPAAISLTLDDVALKSV